LKGLSLALPLTDRGDGRVAVLSGPRSDEDRSKGEGREHGSRHRFWSDWHEYARGLADSNHPRREHREDRPTRVERLIERVLDRLERRDRDDDSRGERNRRKASLPDRAQEAPGKAPSSKPEREPTLPRGARNEVSEEDSKGTNRNRTTPRSEAADEARVYGPDIGVRTPSRESGQPGDRSRAFKILPAPVTAPVQAAAEAAKPQADTLPAGPTAPRTAKTSALTAVPESEETLPGVTFPQYARGAMLPEASAAEFFRPTFLRAGGEAPQAAMPEEAGLLAAPPTDAGVLAAAIEEFLAQLDSAGAEVARALTENGWTPWLLTLAAGALAAEAWCRRARRRRAAFQGGSDALTFTDLSGSWADEEEGA
jgi:hypothetical protein